MSLSNGEASNMECERAAKWPARGKGSLNATLREKEAWSDFGYRKSGQVLC